MQTTQGYKAGAAGGCLLGKEPCVLLSCHSEMFVHAVSNIMAKKTAWTHQKNIWSLPNWDLLGISNDKAVSHHLGDIV